MHFIYKLKNGKYVRLFDQELLSADKRNWDYYYRGYATGEVIDKNGKYIEVSVRVVKDKMNNKFYFRIYGEKIYLSDFEYLDPNDLVLKLASGERVSCDIFISSLIKNPDKFAFIEQKLYSDNVSKDIPGHTMLSYSYQPKFKNVVCVLVENFFEKEQWHYKFETIPVDKQDILIYGIEKHDSKTFYDWIYMGYTKVILKDDIKNYDFSGEKPFTRVYKKKG